MKIFKLTAIVWAIIYIIGSLFLYLRKTDGAGALNTEANRIVSLTIWSFLFIIVLIAYVIWYLQIRRNRK